MADVIVTVGAALDASVDTFFKPVEDAAARAGKRVQDAVNQAQAAGGNRTAQANARRIAMDVGRAEIAVARDVARSKVQLARAAITQESSERLRASRQAAQAEIRQARDVAREKERLIKEEQRNRRDLARAMGMGAYAGFQKGLTTVTGTVGQVARGAGFDVDVGSAIQRRVALERSSIGLANQMTENLSGPQRVAFAGELRSKLTGVGQRTATPVQSLVNAMRKFQADTGNITIGTDQIEAWARTSVATDTDIVSTAGAAGGFYNAMKPENHSNAEAGKILSNTMRVVAGIGRSGAIEMTDVADQVSKLNSYAGRFKADPRLLELTGGSNAAAGGIEALIFAQIARAHGKATPQQATSASFALFRDLQSPIALKRLGDEAGVNLFKTEYDPTTKRDIRTQLRDPLDILKETFHKTKGDLAATGYVFSNQNSRAVASAFADRWRTGYMGAEFGPNGKRLSEKERNAAGDKAMMEEYDEFLKQAVTPEREAEDFNAVMGTAAAKMEKFNQQLDVVLGDAFQKLQPQLEKLLPVVTDIVTKLANMASNNPLDLIGKVILARVTASIAEAAIGQMVGRALTDAIATAMGVPGAAGGAAGSSAIPVLGALLGGAYTGYTIATDSNKVIDKTEKDSRGETLEAYQLSLRLKSGAATAEEVDRANELADKFLGAPAEGGLAGVGNRMVGAFSRPFGGLAKGDFSASNLWGAYVSPLSSVYEGIVGSQGGDERDAASKAALGQLNAGLVARSARRDQTGLNGRDFPGPLSPENLAKWQEGHYDAALGGAPSAPMPVAMSQSDVLSAHLESAAQAQVRMAAALTGTLSVRVTNLPGGKDPPTERTPQFDPKALGRGGL